MHAGRSEKERMQNENLTKSGVQQEPEPETYVEPWGHNHPAVTKLGLGPK